jgi:hypothetical protein
LRKNGADYLVYRLLDTIVDHYFVILEKFGERIEDLEEELMAEPDKETLAEIHRLKSELIFLRKSIWPLREVISGLTRGDSPLIKESTGIFLRDVYDHTIQVIDTVENFRDMVAGMLDIDLSSLSNKMNEVMKVLTIISKEKNGFNRSAGWRNQSAPQKTQRKTLRFAKRSRFTMASRQKLNRRPHTFISKRNDVMSMQRLPIRLLNQRLKMINPLLAVHRKTPAVIRL